MENKTYSQKLREFINITTKYPKVFYFENNNIKLLLEELSKIQLLTDYYLITCKNMKRIDKNLEILNNFRTLMNKKDTLLQDEGLYNQAIKDSKTILNINNNELKMIEMISIMKSLSKEDIDFLIEFNPFFKEEYDLFNIDITSEFIIEKLNKGFNIQDIAKLIINVYKYDEDIICDILTDIIETLKLNNNEISLLLDIIEDENITILSSLINNYYQTKINNQTIKK